MLGSCGALGRQDGLEDGRVAVALRSRRQTSEQLRKLAVAPASFASPVETRGASETLQTLRQ